MIHRFNVRALDATPWKNGGGTTREIAVSPPGAGLDQFTWRVSIADVASDGPFSVFEGVDRVLLLLDGNGVELRTTDGRMLHRLSEPFVPFAFSGDERITSLLLGGAVTDFNVMTRRGVARADVRVIRTPDELPATNAGVLFAARGRWTVRSSALGPMRLGENDGCWWDAEPVAWRVSPESSSAVLLSVGL